MVKKKIKEEVRKDIVVETIGRVFQWVRTNPKLCIIGAAVVVVLGCAVYGYAMYESRKDDRLQSQLSEGIKNFQEYTSSGKEESLAKAEGIFKGLFTSNGRGVRDVAELYLARISYVRGRADEARSLYKDVQNRSSSTFVKKLSEAALQQIDKK